VVVYDIVLQHSDFFSHDLGIASDNSVGIDIGQAAKNGFSTIGIDPVAAGTYAKKFRNVHKKTYMGAWTFGRGSTFRRPPCENVK
jgi:hypothetical protein